jgi:streptomycin 6-kinase
VGRQVTRPADVADLVPPDWRQWIRRLPAEGGPTGDQWADDLPRLLAEVLDEWELQVTGSALTGHTALVLPVLRGATPAMVKVGWPHEDALAEPLALRRWAGDGAVRLLAADPSRGALLLEPLDPTQDLEEVPVEEACEVIGGLLARLHVPALPQLPRLSAGLRRQLERFPRVEPVLPRRMLQRGSALIRAALDDPSVDATLLHTDLHFGNVLAADREDWLAIDPKPLSGHPGWEIAPSLWNRVDEMGTGPALRWSVRQRVEILADRLGLDVDDARRWAVLRLTVEAVWGAIEDDQDQVTRSILLVKALEG